MTRLVPSEPVALPLPIWSVPPEARLIVPLLPWVRAPATITLPVPSIASVPKASSVPTTRLPLFVQVPALIVALPSPDAPLPIVAAALVRLPPETTRAAVVPSPIIRLPVLSTLPPVATSRVPAATVVLPE